MIGVPKRFTRPGSPFAVSSGARHAAQLSKVTQLRNTIETAMRADAAITFEHALPQVRPIASQPPFFDAPLGAEGKPPGGYF